MKKLKRALIALSTSIKDAIRTIDEGSIQIAFVVDAEMKLLGTVTDGDVRRGILRGVSLDAPVKEIMRDKPVSASIHDDRQTLLDLMKVKKIHQIPLLDSEGRLVRVEIMDELIQSSERNNAVVLMAGGLGTRLKPLTDDCPKPLLTVGSKPILEIIIQNFIEQGFKNFYVSVHYKDEMVREYFGDGSKWGATIHYVYESERRGTAGALALLPEIPAQSFIVMNGDLLTKVNFNHLLDFHREQNAKATMCVREYDFQVPYGVVQLDHQKITQIDEKPIHRFFVNAGIYVFEPEILKRIPKDVYFDMPELFKTLSAEKQESVAFPVREYWLDIGRIDDLERANGEFSKIF